MPLIIPRELPAFAELSKENVFVMHRERARNQDIRPLRILILNLMPTKIVTETQLARLLAVFDRSQGGQFVNRFRVYDPRRQDFVWMDMYVGDRTGRPLRVGANFVPLAWADVKANLIQV